jgi:hypothetical protein
MNTHNCRVCGLYIDDLPWGEDGCSPTYEICSCCGLEFGNEDYTIESTNKYREEWIAKGAKWFESKEKPENWNLEEQLKNIPQAFV